MSCSCSITLISSGKFSTTVGCTASPFCTIQKSWQTRKRRKSNAYKPPTRSVAQLPLDLYLLCDEPVLEEPCHVAQRLITISCLAAARLCMLAHEACSAFVMKTSSLCRAIRTRCARRPMWHTKNCLFVRYVALQQLTRRKSYQTKLVTVCHAICCMVASKSNTSVLLQAKLK